MKIPRGPQVILPDGSPIQDNHREEIKLRSLLNTRAKASHIYPHLQSGILISIVKLSDDGFIETLIVINTKVENQGHLVL